MNYIQGDSNISHTYHIYLDSDSGQRAGNSFQFNISPTIEVQYPTRGNLYLKEFSGLNTLYNINESNRTNSIPPCVNGGCERCVEVRSWSIGGVPSLKTECRPCSHARKCNKPLEGITFHKKSYCENIDGFLGFKCPVPPEEIRNFNQSIFELEHVDGNHWNNTRENVKTLCCLCHRQKTSLSKDADSTKKSSMRDKK